MPISGVPFCTDSENGYNGLTCRKENGMSWSFRACPARGILAALIVVMLLASFAPALVLAAPPSANPETYVVQSGDTLSVIVQAYNEKGIKVTTKQILKANPGLVPEKMKVGQKIFIPAPKP